MKDLAMGVLQGAFWAVNILVVFLILPMWLTTETSERMPDVDSVVEVRLSKDDELLRKLYKGMEKCFEDQGK